MTFRRLINLCAIVACISIPAIASADDSKKHALIIGVSNYDPDQLTAAGSSQGDAEKLADLLERAGYSADQLTLMTNRAGVTDPGRLPTLVNLREQLKSVSEKVGRRDSLLVAFSGHGLQTKDGKYVLCPFDADLEDADTLLSIEDVYAALQNCRSKQKLLLVDAMRQSPFSSDIEADVARNYKSVMPTLPASPAGTAVFASCNAGQFATGGFIDAVCKGIQNAAGSDGTVTLPDVERYVKTKFQGRTSPVLHNNMSGLFTVVSQTLDQDEMVLINDLMLLDKYDEALVIVKRRLATHPNDVIALAEHSRIISYRAEQFDDFSDLPLAIEIANKAIALGPNEPFPYVSRATAYLTQKKHELVMADCAAALQRDPNCVLAHVLRGFASFGNNDLDEVLRCAKAALAIDPDSTEARVTMVGYLFGKRDFKGAMEELDRAIAVRPTPTLHFLYGGTYRQLGMPDKAVEQYTKAIELNDRIPQYLCRRAISYAEAGNRQAALADVLAAEKICPKYPDVASAKFMIAHTYAEYQDAQSLLTAGLEKNAKSGEMWQGSGFNLHNMGQHKKAIESFNKALELDPNLAESHMGIGMAYSSLNKYDDALLHLNRATRVKERLSRAYFEKSQVYVYKKNYNAAMVEIDKAIKYEPNQSTYHQLRQLLTGFGARSTTTQTTKPQVSTQPSKRSQPLPADAAKKASVNGKYSQLLAKLSVPGDVKQYGQFRDYGRWNESNYANYRNLPPGYWVYVYPNWYIWKNVTGSQQPLAQTSN